MIGGIDGLDRAFILSGFVLGGFGRRIGVGRGLERAISAASREQKREQGGERHEARAPGERMRELSGHEQLRTVGPHYTETARGGEAGAALEASGQNSTRLRRFDPYRTSWTAE